VVATEVLIPTPAGRNLIARAKTHQIYSRSDFRLPHGMQTMECPPGSLSAWAHLEEARRAACLGAEELKRLLGRRRQTAPLRPP